MSQGGHFEQLLFFALFYQSTPSCLKVGGWVVVAHVIIVSAQSKELGFGFFRLGLTLDPGFGACWDRGLGTWTRAWQYWNATLCPGSAQEELDLAIARSWFSLPHNPLSLLRNVRYKSLFPIIFLVFIMTWHQNMYLVCRSMMHNQDYASAVTSTRLCDHP